MTPISVAICCQNSERTLEAACRSVAWADELVIVDGGSADGTAKIAERYADQYVVEPWRGFTEQKRFATSLCRNDWVLVLDSDEECSAELAREIASLPQKRFAVTDVFRVPRRNYVFGRHVHCWDPDMQSRLIHRDRCTWRDEVLHDARLPSDPARQADLEGWLEHKQADDSNFDDYFHGGRAQSRLPLVARDMYARGRRCRWYDLVLRPVMAFAKFYLFRGGFRQGTFGVLIAQKAAVGAQLKYAALWALQNGALVGGERAEGWEPDAEAANPTSTDGAGTRAA